MQDNRTAYESLLVNTYLPAFLGFARSRVGDMDAAQELAQEMACRCVTAIAENRIRENPDAYFWSVAHNTYKTYLVRRQHISIEEHNLGAVLLSDDPPPEEQAAYEEELASVRRALSHLAGQYRQILVMHYYDGAPVAQIAQTLALSESMVKFYLRSGREKLKELYLMDQTAVSVNPVEFSVYKSAIDFSRVNVWEVFRRKLPGQIAILCHDKPMTVTALSVETCVPAVYLEEEIALLLDAGVMSEPVKGKYRTNFHILRAQASEQIRTIFANLFRDYIPLYRRVYEETLPALKASGAFRYEASEAELRWYFHMHTGAYDYRDLWLSEKDYPQILSCGSRALIYAMEAPTLRFSAGRSPTDLGDAVVWPCDVTAFGEYHRQRELHPRDNTDKCRVLYEIAMGKTPADDEQTRLHIAALIEEGYLAKQDGTLVSRVPVTDKAVRDLFASVNETLQDALKEPSRLLWQRVSDIVKATLPPQLAAYEPGFTATWISFLEGAYFAQALYEDGFLSIPENGDNAPYACEILRKD